MTVLEKTRFITIVFHGDLDGVASAALLARWASQTGRRYRLVHSTVRGLRRTLRDVVNTLRSMGGGGIALIDLSLQGVSDAILYAQYLRGLPAAWFDHHPWPEGAEEKLRAAGVELHRRRDRVSAELVAEALGLSDDYSRMLVEAARADDTCAPGESIADKWRLVLRYLDDPVRAVKALAAGDLWPEWAEKLYREKGSEYLSLAERVAARLRVYEYDGVRVAVVPMEPGVDVCTVQKLLWKKGWSPEKVDVELYIYPRAVSIRTVRIDASCIARKLGGGGHRRAAGAPLRYSYGAAGLARQVAMYAKMCSQG